MPGFVGRGLGQGLARSPEEDRRRIWREPLPEVIDNEYDPENEDGGVFRFLQEHPEFEDRPATIEQFLGPDYLDLEDTIRDSVRQALVDIFGEDIDPERISKKRRAIFTGAIGIGKTTLASIAILYMVHWVLCLHDPQGFFGQMPGRRLAFMLMSTSEGQAKEVLFGDIKASMQRSPWFKRHAPWNDRIKNQIHFPKDVWVLPGTSLDTAFEGYNILGGIIDEADSHKITERKDYAQSGYETIENRIHSRFGDRGLLIVIGQMKSSNGFAARTLKKFEKDPDAATIRLTQWESFGWQKYRNKKTGKYEIFWFDIDRKVEVSAAMARDLRSEKIIPIPLEYKELFDDNPVKALRDQAGIPPDAEDPFIAVYERVESAMMRWHDNHPLVDPLGDIMPEMFQPVNDSCTNPRFHPQLYADSPQKRVLHIDIAYSDAVTADALGMAMGHVEKIVDLGGELKPYIVFDFLLRVKARTGTQIMLHEIRQLVYELKNERGFRIAQVTVDGTNSVDMIQTLQRSRFSAAYLSVDKTRTPYEDLREAIYERRCEFPAYQTYIKPASDQKVIIAAQELRQLEDTGKKIDHPIHGSKDVTDAMAAVVYQLTGSPQYRRGARKEGRDPLAPDGAEDVLGNMGPGYDPEFDKAFEPIDAEFYDERGALQSFMSGLPNPGPGGAPALRDDPFGLMRQSRLI